MKNLTKNGSGEGQTANLNTNAYTVYLAPTSIAEVSLIIKVIGKKNSAGHDNIPSFFNWQNCRLTSTDFNLFNK